MNNISTDHLLSHIRYNNIVLIDVRSPGEYEAGHIRTAVNLSLLNNEERHEVGITYKQKGSDEAVHKGFQLVGKKFSDYISAAGGLAPDKEIYLYCWRGGMRSQIMAWLLTTAGFRVNVLKGGYKSYRQWCLATFQQPHKFCVLSGLTGCGKTEILGELRRHGESTVDIEALAHHKGSSFGGIGQPHQPNQEQFENEFAWQLSLHGSAPRIWLEDESRFIGRVRIPDAVFEQIQKSPVVMINREKPQRIERILSEYGNFPEEILEDSTMALTRRMGGDQVKVAIEALRSGDMHQWAELLLRYYDKTYLHSAPAKKERIKLDLKIQSETPAEIAQMIIDHNFAKSDAQHTE